MKTSLEALRAQVYAQKELVPSLYGDIDFSITPERFSADADVKSLMPRKFEKKYRGDILQDKERVERARLYTMLGDHVSDAYAALMGQYRMPQLIQMLKDACDHGVEKVPDAPPELVNFIRAMEEIPDWIDMKLVRKGARVSRTYMAHLVPFAIRGSFVATFMNKYSGLPMALTGTLTDDTSLQRINETASFFTTASMPGSLDRFGPGFKAAAMVRLMHSMVRFNLLKRSGKWDVSVYGIPVPKVDQMPAGTMPAFITAFNLVQRRKTEFSSEERAVVELCRYQSYLLGLPEDLLPDTPRDIFNVMLTYAGTLRDGYDDETCGSLVRSTMAVYRPQDQSLRSKVFNTVETGFSKVFFTHTFLRGADKNRARMMGVNPGVVDYLCFLAANAYVLPRVQANLIAQRIPLVRRLADRALVKKINGLLVEYGHAEYVSDGDRYAYEKDGKKAAA